MDLIDCPFLTARFVLPGSTCHTSNVSVFSRDCPDPVMSRSQFLSLFAGLSLTLAQIAAAVLLLAPEGPLSYRYSTLVQHDSYWFMNIIDRGYGTPVPPINQKVMEVSNVAFFPGYPAIAALLHYGFHLATSNALLIAAQIAAWGFWSYFFLFCQRWNVSPSLQFFGALSILAHPAAFFLIAAYSESLFLLALMGFIYWTSIDSRTPKFLGAIHGILMCSTRIVGIPCAAFPLVRSIVANGWEGLRQPTTWFRVYVRAAALMVVATSGALAFFAYCQLRWGNWNLYMLTQAAGWGIVPDYLAVFKPSSYHWLIPALDNPTQTSQMSMTLGALLFVPIVICEFVPAIHERANWPTRAGIYFCAAVIYYVSVSGVACVNMESMLRYEFCVHALIVLGVLNLLRQVQQTPAFVRALGILAIILACAAGLSLQGWYLWNFTRGNWIA